MGRVFATLLVAGLASPALVLPAGAQEDEAEAPRQVERRAIVRALAPAAAGGGHLGVQLEDVDSEVVERLGLPQERGALVVNVTEESPAAEAGIREDDIIFEWNGEAVESVAELTRLVRETPPGREVGLRVFRDGASRDLRVEVGERESVARAFEWDEERAERMRDRMRRVHRQTERAREQAGRAMERLEERRGELPRAVFFRGGSGRMGVRLQSLTPQLADYFGLEDGSGALVASVREESPAADAGLRAGDVIVSLAGEAVEGPRDVARAVRTAEAGTVELSVVREGEERTLTVELPERSETSFDLRDVELEDIDFEELEIDGVRLGEEIGEALRSIPDEIEIPEVRFEAPGPPVRWIRAAPSPPAPRVHVAETMPPVAPAPSGPPGPPAPAVPENIVSGLSL